MGYKMLTSIPFPRTPCHSSQKYTYMHTKTQSHIATHPCKQKHAYILLPSHTHISNTHTQVQTPKEGTFQGILTIYHQGLLTLPMAFRSQLLLDVRGAFCHHNHLFTCKLRPRVHTKQDREEALGKSSLPGVGAQGKYILTWGVEPYSQLGANLGPAPSVHAVSCWLHSRPSPLLLCKQHRRRDKAQNFVLQELPWLSDHLIWPYGGGGRTGGVHPPSFLERGRDWHRTQVSQWPKQS